MRILFTICGRAGSKGIKNKNIQNFLGKPLPAYALSLIDLYLKEHPEVEYDIVLNTDSKDLMEMLSIISINKMRKIEIIERTAELSGDEVAKCDVIRNCYSIMQKRKDKEYDTVVDLDIGSPIRRRRDMDNLIRKTQDMEYDIVESVTESRRSPYFNIVQETDCGVRTVIESYFTTRQSVPVTYDENAALCAYNPCFLRSSMRWDDSHREIILMPDTGVLDLDRPQDLELMQVIAKYLLSKDADFRYVYENID